MWYTKIFDSSTIYYELSTTNYILRTIYYELFKPTYVKCDTQRSSIAPRYCSWLSWDTANKPFHICPNNCFWLAMSAVHNKVVKNICNMIFFNKKNLNKISLILDKNAKILTSYYQATMHQTIISSKYSKYKIEGFKLFFWRIYLKLVHIT